MLLYCNQGLSTQTQNYCNIHCCVIIIAQYFLTLKRFFIWNVCTILLRPWHVKQKLRGIDIKKDFQKMKHYLNNFKQNQKESFHSCLRDFPVFSQLFQFGEIPELSCALFFWGQATDFRQKTESHDKTFPLFLLRQSIVELEVRLGSLSTYRSRSFSSSAKTQLWSIMSPSPWQLDRLSLHYIPPLLSPQSYLEFYFNLIGP